MTRYASRIANVALFVLCCFLLANAANTVFAALLSAEPAVVDVAAPAPPTESRGWQDREIILKRNLFNASLLAPEVSGSAPDELEDLEETKLPLSLIGTVAGIGSSPSWAAVEDLEERKTLILKPDDPVKRGATVMRIERARVVLLENGKPRELVLDEDDKNRGVTRPSSARRRTPNPRALARSSNRERAGRAQRIRELARDRYQVEAEDVQEVLRNPASLLSQAQIQPEFDDESDEMIGVRVSSVKPGSVFEQAGIEDGDVITELNGIQINSPDQSARIYTELSKSKPIKVVVEDADGNPRTLTFDPSEAE